jgi:hypothetical protein
MDRGKSRGPSVWLTVLYIACGALAGAIALWVVMMARWAYAPGGRRGVYGIEPLRFWADLGGGAVGGALLVGSLVWIAARRRAGTLGAGLRGVVRTLAPSLIVLAVLGAVAGWWFFLRQTPEQQVVRQYLEAARAGNDEQVEFLCSKSTRDLLAQAKQLLGTAYPGAAELIGGPATYYNKPRFRVEQPKTNGDHAQLKVYWIFKDGRNYHTLFSCVRENGRWKVDASEGLAAGLAYVAPMLGKPRP